jgi:hypothetical protein
MVEQARCAFYEIGVTIGDRIKSSGVNGGFHRRLSWDALLIMQASALLTSVGSGQKCGAAGALLDEFGAS